jgi:hypothetical protein
MTIKENILEGLGIDSGEFQTILAKEILNKQEVKRTNKIKGFGGYPRAKENYLKHYESLVPEFGNQIDLTPLNETAYLTDCLIDNPIVNSIIYPTGNSIGSIIPVVNRPLDLRSPDEVKYAFMVKHTRTVSGTKPDEICKPGENVATADELCTISYPWGRWVYSTKTAELEEMLTKACHDETFHRTNYYFVNPENGFSAVRGMGDLPGRLNPLTDRELIYQAGLRKELAGIGEQLSADYAYNVWYGSPTNNVGNGTKYFWGLDYMIRDDWAAGTVDTPAASTNCSDLASDASVLNSFLWDGTTVADNPKLGAETTSIFGTNLDFYKMMHDWESNFYAKVVAMGMAPLTGVFVMPRVFWPAIAATWPVEETEAAQRVLYNNSFDHHLNTGRPGEKIINESTRMLNERRLIINGRSYPVFFDDNLIIDNSAIGKPLDYTSTMYFLPLQSRGVNLIEASFFNFSNLYDPFGITSPLNPSTAFLGWSDGGRYFLNLNVKSTCFNIDLRTKPGLILRTPQLAAKWSGLTARREFLPMDIYDLGLAPNFLPQP